MFTLEDKIRNQCVMEMAERLADVISESASDRLVASLENNSNSILFADDARLQATLDNGKDIVVHGLAYNVEKGEITCSYHLLDRPTKEHSCNVQETDLDMLDILQAINDTYDNDPESM